MWDDFKEKPIWNTAITVKYGQEGEEKQCFYGTLEKNQEMFPDLPNIFKMSNYDGKRLYWKNEQTA